MKKPHILLFLVLLATYLVLAFSLPTDPEVLAKHDLSQLAARVLNLTILVPITAVYLSALYGFIRVKDYAKKVRDTKEGTQFKNIADGLMLLAYSLPINSIFGSIGSYIQHSRPHLLSDITIVRQYIALMLALLAILLISKGAQGLLGTLKKSNTHSRIIYLLGPIILASIYTWLITTQTSDSNGQPYFLPDWLVIISIVIPYVYMWCIGIRAAILMHRYQNGVKGLLYKRAIDWLAKGVATIIIISILLQFLTTVSGFLNRLNLTPLLTVIYVLVAIYAVGYGLVARGAKKLKQLEEV